MKDQKHSVPRAFIRLIGFAAIFIALLLTLDTTFFDRDTNIQETWAYIQTEDIRPIDVLFVGNSHTYSAFDADAISGALNINARVLACPSANAAMMVASLEAFLQYQVPRAVSFEILPFAADNDEYMRAKGLGITYAHFDGVPGRLNRLRALTRTVNFEDIPAGLIPLFRGESMWKRWEKPLLPEDESFYTTGYKALSTFQPIADFDAARARDEYLAALAAAGDGALSPRDEAALYELMRLSEKYGFEVWFSVSPVAQANPLIPPALAAVKALSARNGWNLTVDDFMALLPELKIDGNDFYDTAHLCRRGAEKVTDRMIDLIASRFSIERDDTDVILYKGESVTLNPDGSYRFQMECYGDALYRFGCVESAAYSEQNWLDIPASSSLLANASAVTVEMIPASGDEEEAYVSYSFMPAHIAVRDYELTLMADGFIVRDSSDYFTDDMAFSWYIIDVSDQTIDKIPYAEERSLTYFYQGSGVFTIRAYARCLAPDARSSLDIATLEYDEETGQTRVISAMSCVSVTEE